MVVELPSNLSEHPRAARCPSPLSHVYTHAPLCGCRFLLRVSVQPSGVREELAQAASS